ncbi:NAD(P)/FAD-dependent oxidoreductase [Streptomyces sp. NBC_00273]|uniref:NAD(P)/FAD-dependent oxidoreductase n=1 Tax=Streptomyces sp. NBC_00273 TaxID=2903644 RepID=UPI002E2ACDCC|nr:FAD-dependent oxidoreductase [Streptomyces sp. NBC_00273]
MNERNEAAVGERVRHEVDVVVVGAGPSGLAAAIALRQAGVARVEVLERESAAGGIPRHCAHTGYGVRDLRRVMSGPRYARHYAQAARAAGVELSTTAMVTGWSADGGLEVSSPAGLRTVHASAVLLATGARERGRAARWVPGDRGEGVYTTGQLQQEVYLRGQQVGSRALVVGAEHVSFSAVTTLRHAGVEVVGLTTELPQHQSYAVFNFATRMLYKTPLLTGTRVVELRGRPRLTHAVLMRLSDGRQLTVPCDTIVFTGDWIPDHELARTAGLQMDPATLGPTIDATGSTSRPGIFAAGNLCHPVETADVAALGGRHVGGVIARWLADRSSQVAGAGVPIEVGEALAWVSPQRIGSTAELPARGRLILRPRVFATLPWIRVNQGERVLWQRQVPKLIPSRPTLLPATWLARVDPHGPAVRIEVLV